MKKINDIIRAEVHTDDFMNTAKFDAAEYFETVDIEEIVRLELCDWGAAYEADNVAIFFDGKDGFEDVSSVFANTTRRRQGFECHIHRSDVMGWLYQHRPELFFKFGDVIGVSPRELLVDEGEPFWDLEPEWVGKSYGVSNRETAKGVSA